MRIAEDEKLGTRSTFGKQALSTRATRPEPGFTRGGRTQRLAGFEALQRGAASPGPAYDAPAGVGERQVLSRRANAPAVTIGAARGAAGAARARAAATAPGPGSYATDFPTLGRPVRRGARAYSGGGAASSGRRVLRAPLPRCQGRLPPAPTVPWAHRRP
jgi:hypothetical protein